MEKTVILFSGQGSQYVGMGKELCEIYPELLSIYDKAGEICGIDLKEIVFSGEESALAQTIVSQPAIMATSLVAFEAAKKKGITFDGVAGHSLGEYAAMVASGILTMEDGFKVIKARASAMQKAAEANPGAMYAIIGKTGAEIEEVCASIDGYVLPVNYNSSAQTVIAGEVSAAEKAAEKFTEMGAKVIKLGVTAAFHSKLMQSAADEFKVAIAGVEFSEPSCEFYSNLIGKKQTDFSNMPEKLALHIVSPVRFTSELGELESAGYKNFVECGPNKVLTGLVKKTLKGVTAVNIENEKTLEKFCEAVGL